MSCPPSDRIPAAAVIDAAVLVGQSPATELIRRSLVALAPLATHLIFTGEPGTGRRTCAELLHQQGPGRDRPFVRVPLAGATHTEVDAAIFGANGATRLAAGAGGATLYLEDVERLSAPVQAHLAAALVDAEMPGLRVLAATTRSLETHVRSGRFVRALYERIGLLQISIPPLRERAEDIRAIAEHALDAWNQRHRGLPRRFGSGALAVLETHSWPGNVRELVTIVHAACASTRARTLTAERLRLVLGRRPRRAIACDVAPLRDVECDYILDVLARCNGNRSFAARRLGIGRNTLARRLRECDRHFLRAAS